MRKDYRKIAYIGLRNSDGSQKTSVPLYVLLGGRDKNGTTDGEETLIHNVSTVILRYYERKISDFMVTVGHPEIKNEESIAQARRYAKAIAEWSPWRRTEIFIRAIRCPAIMSSTDFFSAMSKKRR